MIPKEILKQVRQIQIRSNKMVSGVLAGEYKSAFKGRGIEFEEVREYIEGDEIRTIDWNVTARTGTLHVKNYREERELTVMFVIDMSSSGQFGTTSRTKLEIATEIAAVLAFSAIKSNDKVGLIMFTDEVEKYIPPKKGKSHVLRVIRELLFFKPEKVNTDINVALEFLNKVTKRKSICFLVSDFYSDDFEKSFLLTSKKHDLVPIAINDPTEVSLPDIGLIELEDEETGEIYMIDTKNVNVSRSYKKVTSEITAERNDFFKSAGVDYIDVNTSKPYIHELIKFFDRREKRL